MSFSSDQKKEIIEQHYKNSCCRKALLCGALVAKATACGDNIIIAANSRQTLDFIASLIREFYSQNIDQVKSTSGGRGAALSFSSRSCAKFVGAIDDAAELFFCKCSFCRSAFLRGLFLACGRVSDPAKQYMLEFAPIGHHERILRLFALFEISAKYMERKKEKLIYLKKSSAIEDFFALAGMNATAFQLINAKIKNEIRNNANRIANCETNNIGKAVDASHQQLELLDELQLRGLLSSLPEELENTARLRLENRTLSLSALSKLSVPPLSKSGLSHRLDRILEIGAQLIEKQD